MCAFINMLRRQVSIKEAFATFSAKRDLSIKLVVAQFQQWRHYNISGQWSGRFEFQRNFFSIGIADAAVFAIASHTSHHYCHSSPPLWLGHTDWWNMRYMWCHSFKTCSLQCSRRPCLLWFIAISSVPNKALNKPHVSLHRPIPPISYLYMSYTPYLGTYYHPIPCQYSNSASRDVTTEPRHFGETIFRSYPAVQFLGGICLT
jgi:hypothetical protein